MTGVTVCVPAFNEACRLPYLLAELEEFVRLHSHLIHEIILVDDGSTDSTVERALYWSERLPLRIERLQDNMGKWAAIRHGLSVSCTDAVLILDADGSASIWELAKLPVKEIVEQRACVFGSRFASGATCEGKEGIRLLVSQGYRNYARLMYRVATGKTDVDDMQAPWKLVHKSQISAPLTVDRFAGDIELASLIKVPIRTHPIDFQHRTGSKVKLNAVFEMAIDTFRTAIRIKRKIVH